MSCTAQDGHEKPQVEDNGKEPQFPTTFSTVDPHKVLQNRDEGNFYDPYNIRTRAYSDPGRRPSVYRKIQRAVVLVLRKSSVETERETWGSPADFIMSCISLSVGLGNVWRFPIIAASNGGGAFLIPYLVVLFAIGRPLYYLEMCMGQFSQYGQVKVWNMAPIMKGIGYSSLTALICVTSYFCVLMGIMLFYLLASFSDPLPWTVCDPNVHGNATCGTAIDKGQLAKLYYHKIVFPQLQNVDKGLGGFHWHLVLGLAITWLIIFLTLVKGIKVSGKVAYFTASFPYVVLVIFLIRGVTLKGAWTGILYFITPQWDRLLEARVWYAAIEQCLFSLGLGFGPIIMLSSFNPFCRNVYTDAQIISVLDTATSLLAGCTVFSMMGYLVTVSNEEYGTNMTFQDIEGGLALAFILYPQAISEFALCPQAFSVLLMLMLITLAIGCGTCMTGGMITIICDQFPNWTRWKVVFGVCLLGFASGLLYATEGGIFMMDLVDHYGVGIVVYIVVMLECAGVTYVYGLKNFCRDIEFMLGKKVGIYWKFCWGVTIPFGLSVNLIYYLVLNEHTSNGIPYPWIATICGWLLTAFAVSLIPLCAIHSVYCSEGKNLREKFVSATGPTQIWGPQQSIQRREWLEFKAL